MFRLEMLPAGSGDCLLLQYGSVETPHIVVIDGGVGDTATVLKRRLEGLRDDAGLTELPIELLVVTHIDTDHIDGIRGLLADGAPQLRIQDIWFNGTEQLKRLKPREPRDRMGSSTSHNEDDEFSPSGEPGTTHTDFLGPAEGEDLSERIKTLGIPWNQAFLGKLVGAPEKGDLTLKEVGDLKITVLGPNRKSLDALVAAWRKKLGGIGDVADDMMGKQDTWPPVFKEGEGKDSSQSNGSSIALLIEYGEFRLLLPGDAHAPDLAAALRRLAKKRKVARIELSAFKLSHHGSIANISKGLMDAITCENYLISTDGIDHAHPDYQAILRVLKHSVGTPCLYFNYQNTRNAIWRDKKLDMTGNGEFRTYETEYPEDAAQGIAIDFR